MCVLGGRTVVPFGLDGERDGVSIGLPVDRVAGRAESEDIRADPLPVVDDADGCAARGIAPAEGREEVDDAAGCFPVEPPVLRVALDATVAGGL